MFPLEKPPQQIELIFEKNWHKRLAEIWLKKEKIFGLENRRKNS
jgi:hypothetical protein